MHGRDGFWWVQVGPGGHRKWLQRAEIARKVAKKMGPHQADSGLKEAMQENKLQEPELDQLERLVRARMRTCIAGTDSGGFKWAQVGRENGCKGPR